MGPQAHGRLFVISAVLTVAALGCGQGAASGDLDKVRIEVSPVDVTVTNTAGRALLDVRLEIFPVGRATSYSTYVGRLESAEKRSFVFSRFSDRDAVPFSPRTARATAVAVTGKDIDGVTVRAEIPWK